MSYILEALKKSDRERQRNGVPGLHSVHDSGASSPVKRARWPRLLLFLALLVNGAAIAALLFYLHRAERAASPAVTLIEKQTPAGPAPAAVALPASTPEAVQSGTGQPPPIRLAQTTPPSPSAQGQPTAAQDSHPAVGPVRPGPLSAQAQPSAKASVVEENEEDLDDSNEEEIEEEQPEDSPVASTDSAQPPARPIPARGAGHDQAPAEIPYIDKLPASVRSSLPQLAISFHVYSQKQESRLVSINGKLVREGQEVAESLRLEQIIPEGVILNYKGERFRMKVF